MTVQDRMRILLIHNRYTQSGGEDTVFNNEVQLLRENDNEVETIIFENKEVHTIYEKIQLFVNSIFSFPSFFCVKKVISSFKPDIIHIHNLFYTASPSIIWAAKLNKIPVVLTLHNFRLLCPGTYLLRNGKICEKCRHKSVPYWGVFYRCFKNSVSASLVLTITLAIHKILGTWRNGIAAIIALTPFAAELFEKSSIKINKKKVHIKPNWTFAATPNRIERNETFLYVGRLSEEKGIPFLLETFKETGLPLQIIGDGPLREDVRNIKAQNIVWLGSRSHDLVLKKMAESKALVFASCWYEMFPMVIIEALATGTPVIAPNLGSIPYIIKHGKTGLLFIPNNKQDFQKQLDLINVNQALYKQMQELSLQEFLEKYSPEKAFSNLMGIYQKLVPGCNPK